MNEIETIQKEITECIDKWEAKASNNPFSTVDDMLSVFDYDIYYAVHMGWVGAWNKSNREKTMNIFLREWNTIENISNALKKWGYEKEGKRRQTNDQRN